MTWKFGLFTCAALLMTLLASCTLFPEEEFLPPPIIPRVEVAHNTMIVELRDIVDLVRFRGTVAPVRQYNLYLDAPSAVLIEHSISPDIRAQADDILRHNLRVQEGDILAVFANEDIEAQIAPLQRAIELAQINYSAAARAFQDAVAHYSELRSRADRDRQNIEDTYAAAIARYQLDGTHADALRQAQVRYQFGDISSSALRQAEVDYDNAVSRSEQDLRQAEIDYRNAIWQLDQNLRTARANAGNDTAVRRERLNLTIAQENLQELQDRIENFVIRSPIDGVITFFDELIIGSTYRSDQRLFTISDDSSLFITVALSDMQIITGHPLLPGTDVQLTTMVNIGGEGRSIAFEGTVISASIDLLRAASLSEDTVVIEVHDWPEYIGLGTPSVTVSVLQDGRYNVVVIPISALHETGSYTFVRIVENGVSRERPVEIGLTTSTDVEIISGLEPGDEIVVR